VSDARYTPFYGCVMCGEDVGTPAEELRLLPSGDIICRNCYEQDNPPEAGEWDSLPAFVPELRAEVERVTEDRDAARESCEGAFRGAELVRKRLTAAEQRASELVGLLERVDVVMDTAAIHGAVCMIPPEYQRGWAELHAAVGTTLAKSPETCLKCGGSGLGYPITDDPCPACHPKSEPECYCTFDPDSGQVIQGCDVCYPPKSERPHDGEHDYPEGE